MTREEVIKRLKDILEEVTETDNSVCYVTSDDADALSLAIKVLEQQPKWIPCSEKLPEKGRKVLIYINDGSKCGVYVSYRMIYNIWEGHGRLNEDTVAWMPLPEMYKIEDKIE